MLIFLLKLGYLFASPLPRPLIVPAFLMCSVYSFLISSQSQNGRLLHAKWAVPSLLCSKAFKLEEISTFLMGIINARVAVDKYLIFLIDHLTVKASFLTAICSLANISSLLLVHSQAEFHFWWYDLWHEF